MYPFSPFTAASPIVEIYSISTPVKSVIFDFGGVLVKPDENALITYLASSFGVSEDEIRNLQVRELQWIRVNDNRIWNLEKLCQKAFQYRSL